MARRHIMESTFRLNLLNPQHAKINEVIKGLNPKIYKSKNQFLIEACEFYIDHYGEDDIPSKEEKRYEQFVTRDEIEKIKKEIEYSAMSEARKEVISLLGGALAGVKNSQPVVIANPQEDMEEGSERTEKDHKEENGYYQKREVGAYADNEEKTVTDIYFSGCSVIRVSWLSDKWCMDRRDCL